MMPKLATLVLVAACAMYSATGQGMPDSTTATTTTTTTLTTTTATSTTATTTSTSTTTTTRSSTTATTTSTSTTTNTGSSSSATTRTTTTSSTATTSTSSSSTASKTSSTSSSSTASKTSSTTFSATTTTGTTTTSYISGDCPGFLRDLFVYRVVNWMDMRLECEGDAAPSIHVLGKFGFSYLAQWPFACADPMNTTMYWQKFPSTLFQPCNTSSDCRSLGCNAACTGCQKEDCGHRRTCEPEPNYESWAACLVRLEEVPVNRDVVERACQDPRDTCMAWKHQHWDPLGCQIFEREEGFVPGDRATAIAAMCAGYLEEYTLCLERYRYSDPVFFHHRSAGPSLRRNLDATMLGPGRCVKISWEKAARVGAKTCNGAPGLAEA